MPVEIKMPQMGESITEGTVIKWFVSAGDPIERDEPLFEISTDKVDTEIPSPASGYIAEVLVQVGETVPVDTLVCVLTEEKPDPAALKSSSARPAGEIAEAGEAASPAGGAASKGEDKTWLSPAVRKLVREHGIDAAEIQGSGEGGRLSRKDVLNYIESRKGSPAAAADSSGEEPAPIPGVDRIEPMSVMRRKIAEHMVHSKSTSPHVSTVHEVDFTDVDEFRKKHRAEWQERGVKLTYLPFLTQAVARALIAYPDLNASLIDDKIHYKGEVNIGLAVALENGLVVPVLHHADKLSIAEIAAGVSDLADRARNKTLKPGEVQGGTFTITNPGGFGTLIGTPIINQPQSGILCFGAVQKRVVVVPGTDSIGVRNMSYLTLTFDHRLIDGAIADQFMENIRKTIETVDCTLDK
ncbi:MAG: dihydrolipoamide acetyltransferase family protein [Planctomycetota bacterium]|nr:dihydrolipoamide acetyltransferase family protein [Planctomycetota bacterium]